MQSLNVNIGAGTAYPPGSHELTPGFSGVHVDRPIVSCVVLCRSLIVSLAIVLTVVLRFTASNYPFSIFKLFLETTLHRVHVWSCLSFV